MTRESLDKEEISFPLFMLWFGILVWFDLQTTIMITGAINQPINRFYIIVKSMIILTMFLVVLRITD